MHIFANECAKAVITPDYNYLFRKTDGFFARWGKTQADDPQFSPYGPEILDLEISSGECLGNCAFCYKCNGSGTKTVNMTFAQFKSILDKMPKVLTQIAFGITNAHGNADFFKMMRYAREQGVIPNYTTHGLDVTQTVADLTANLCGAVAVSIVNKEKSYDAIKTFSEAIERSKKPTLRQINIHYMISTERLENAQALVDDVASDPRLKKVNAIVWLQYKNKGRHPDAFHSVTDINDYKKLISYCEGKKIGYGFDSCSAHLFLESIQGRTDEQRLGALAEPCESNLFSFYINCQGMAYPCSFCEGAPGWEEGISVLDAKDFLDVWNHERFTQWRKTLLGNCRKCPVYNI